MIKVLKFFTTVSILLFLVVILIVYAFIPEPSGLLFNKDGVIIYEASKDSFFYSSLFIFVLIQFLFMIFNKTILVRIEVSHFKKISVWLQGMILSINLFIILMIIFIGLANNAIDYSFTSIKFLAYLAPSIVVIWLATLPFYVFFPKK